MTEDRRTTTRDNDVARTECYEKVRACLREALQGFYRENPELMKIINEKTAQSTVDRTMFGVRCVINVLEQYEIRQKPR